MSGFRPCVVIPTHDNPATIRAVVEQVRRRLPDVVVIDDASGEAGRAEVARLGAEGLAHVRRLARNSGKGGAVKAGFSFAEELGYTHALQVDADGQHELADLGTFLARARERPEALVLGAPIFDRDVPRGRLLARQITRFWTHLETGGRVIEDPMCGFRVYPLAAVRGLRTGDWMDFDIEVAVRLVWRGVPVVNLPTRVHYPSEGVSHFQLVRDNVRISWLHTRLVCGALVRAVARWFGGRR
jgi:glycosyltransferase involved in cell wall biosynthesis